MSDVAPALSVIIASAAPLRAAPECLAGIVKQRRGRQVEIILAHCSAGRVSGDLEADHPDVTFIGVPRAVALPELLGTALARARGEIIAITDAACAIDESWVSAVVRAHERPHPVIGGAVEPDGLRSLVDWAAYFCDYGQFMLPLAEGIVREVPGINISVKRWALSRGRGFVEEEFWKTYWCRRIQAEGLHLYSVPTIVVSYRKSFRLWVYLVHRFQNGRCFAGMRIAQLTRLERMVHLAASPGLPILFSTRLLRAVVPKRRHMREFVLSFPIVVVALVSWAVGEFCGYLSGPGASCRHVR